MGETIMEYIDNVNNKHYDNDWFNNVLAWAELLQTVDLPYKVELARQLTESGYTVDIMKHDDYKNIPKEWVIKLLTK